MINPETGQPFENEDLETVPQVIQKLVDDKYRAVFVAAGDSVSLAISEIGELKVWGSYRVSEASKFIANQANIDSFDFILSLLV